ncbi:Ribonuclease VapC [Candidatus Accumulibacter aalborgensis]|uniref:Ribonuclease VapC n=1 Tax=Candidatus Accumulibacter aalborgensis TaxID=1860102 RepID=A0A1A8XTA9_9PROT|nr:PIN domain-containing protein [Candidatus Accumulibacter aalborgensis]SBT07188.1 Ribonuclease VapC [Candidatus Accumulibacter aalborgensis]
MRYLLDTNIFIAGMKGVERVRNKLETTPVSEVILSPVVLGELEYGVEKSLHREKNAAHLARIVGGLQLIALDVETSHHYGIIRAKLERQGAPIGANDYWIAAQALALRAVLVTDNLGEFARVPGLMWENWLA